MPSSIVESSRPWHGFLFLFFVHESNVHQIRTWSYKSPRIEKFRNQSQSQFTWYKTSLHKRKCSSVMNKTCAKFEPILEIYIHKKLSKNETMWISRCLLFFLMFHLDGYACLQVWLTKKEECDHSLRSAWCSLFPQQSGYNPATLKIVLSL